MSSAIGYIPIIVFFAASVSFLVSMYYLGVEDGALLNDPYAPKDNRATAMSATMVSAGVIIAAWISRYGITTGLFGFEELKNALLGQTQI
jgi:hypothetical protein